MVLMSARSAAVDDELVVFSCLPDITAGRRPGGEPEEPAHVRSGGQHREPLGMDL